MKVDKSIKNLLKNIKAPKIEAKNFSWERVSREEMEEKIKKLIFSPYLYIIAGFIVGIIFISRFRLESKRPLNPILFYNRLEDVRSDQVLQRQRLNQDIKKA